MHVAFSTQLEAKVCANYKLKGLGRKAAFTRYKLDFTNSLGPIEPFFGHGIHAIPHRRFVLDAVWDELQGATGPADNKKK